GKLDGITRIELDGVVWPSDRRPNETALTPDGNLLYVVNRNASVSIVDAVTRQVVGELLNGGDFGQLRGIVTDGAYVYVTGDDGAGQPHLFAFQAGVLDDSGFLLKTPVTERPTGTALSADGNTVFMTARFAGELMIADVSQIGSLQVTVQNVPIATGLFEVAEASEDQLLWVSNHFRSAIHAVDLAPGPGQYSVVTTLGAPVCSLHMAVPPVFTSGLPVVGAVSPSSGDAAGGDPVILTGANFEAGAVVRFGANLATGVVVDSSFSIHAVTPASTTGSGPVDVEVENPGGESGVLNDGFTYAQDLTPPVFTVPPYVANQVLTGDPATVTAEIRWTTDEASTSVVDYRQVGAPVFDQVSDAALVTSHVILLTGLRAGTGMEFRATSADVHGNAASSPAAPALATFTTLSVPDTTPPIIVSGPTVSVTTDTAQVQWTTNEQATSVVQFDAVLDDGNFDRQAFGASGTFHSVELTSLAPATEHEYKVISVDPSGNLVESPKLYFTTLALADTTPPVVTDGPAVSYLSNDLVIVTWATDELSTSFVNYGTAVVDEQSVVDVDLVTIHVVFLTNLLPGTAYGYQFGSTDASGNTVLSADPFDAFARPRDPTALEAPLWVAGVVLEEGSTLTLLGASDGFTTAEVADVTAPEVLAVEVTPLSFDRVLIAVTVGEAASLRASYGVGGLTDQVFAPAFSQTPDLVIAGLAGNTTYQLSLELTDPHGNVATVAGLEFVTPAAPDVQAPVISGVTVTALTATTARIEWQTDEPADSTVRFGAAGGALDRQAGLLGLRTVHAVLLTGLAPSTAYDFEAASRDASGNLGSATGSFATLTAAPMVTSLTPPQAIQGTSLEIAINGANFGFDSVVDFGAGIAVEVLSVNQIGTRIQVGVSVSLAAAAGQRPVTVTTGGQAAAGSFTV
ncbi:MAG: fibronectin type III domain-containing protein, partial [Thermoanaerobaculia bacterium]